MILLPNCVIVYYLDSEPGVVTVRLWNQTQTRDMQKSLLFIQYSSQVIRERKVQAVIKRVVKIHNQVKTINRVNKGTEGQGKFVNRYPKGVFTVLQ